MEKIRRHWGSRLRVAGLAILCLVAACEDAEEEQAEACSNGMAAFAAATDYARGRLALPPLSEVGHGTINIPGGRTEYLGECRHKVTSHVPRTESAGTTGTVKSDRFEAVVQYKGRGRWVLDSMTIY